VTTTLRSDARRNRASLVAAAQGVFATAGVRVPLEEVAVTAGLGRGTLYRHFPDRASLVSAVYEDALTRYEAFAAELSGEPDVVLRLLVEITSHQPELAGLHSYLLTVPQGHAQVAALTERARRLFAEHLPTSRDAGAVRPDVTVDDLILVLAMVEGVVAGHDRSQVHDAVARCLAMVLPALRP
jgi:AcrR family transcriptional regulator